MPGQNGRRSEDKERVGESYGWPETSAFVCDWRETESGVVRVIHGLSPRLDRVNESIRKERCGALGNTIIPKIAYAIGAAILKVNKLRDIAKGAC